MKQRQNYNMKKIALLFLLVLFIVPSSFGQKSYFYDQKNIFSIHARLSPRISVMRNDVLGAGSSSYGSYYQHYDENGNLISGNQKVNLMLNASYLRMVGRKIGIGLEFSYQKHNMTIHENYSGLYTGYDDNSIDYEEHDSFTASTPVFNVYEVKFIAGSFLGRNIAPSRHLLHYGIGFRTYSLDQSKQYHYDKDTPVTHRQFMSSYDSNFTFLRLTVGYTYRLLLTKNLSLDLGADFNLGGGNIMGLSSPESFPEGYFYFKNEGNYEIYDRAYMKNRMGFETFSNVIYFRAGVSFAI